MLPIFHNGDGIICQKRHVLHEASDALQSILKKRENAYHLTSILKRIFVMITDEVNEYR